MVWNKNFSLQLWGLLVSMLVLRGVYNRFGGFRVLKNMKMAVPMSTAFDVNSKQNKCIVLFYHENNNKMAILEYHYESI